MASLQLPEEYEAGIAEIISASDDFIQQLEAALDGAPMIFRYQDLAANVAESISTLFDNDVDEIIEVLVSLYIVRSSADVSISEFADDVTEAVEESDIGDLLDSEDTREKFKQRLTKLLDVNSLAFTSKARSIQRENEHTFCSTGIMTDIRPVFGTSSNQPPMAAVLVHQLRITYHQGGALKSFFVALDSEDLEKLKGLIEKASDEGVHLKSILDVAKVPYSDSE